MTIREVTMYQVHCDEPGCDCNTGSTDFEYYAFSDKEGAELDWTAGGGVGNWDENQVTPEGKHYCSEHIKPECAATVGCYRTEGLINEDPDSEGDWFCAEHLERAAS